MARGGKQSPFQQLAVVVRTVAAQAITELLRAEPDATAWERVEYSEGQGGTAPRKIDRLLDSAWQVGLRRETRLPIVARSEELDDADIIDAPEGAYIAVVDPLDGTSNRANLGIGSAMSVVVYKKATGGIGEMLYVGVHVIQIDWRRHWWADPTSTWRGRLDSPITEDVQVASPRDLPPGDESDLFVAGVGSAAGETRDFLNHLTAHEGLRTVTIGGTPLGPELLDRELFAIVECKRTTVFDSAHLMLMANTDAVVGRLDGSRLSGEDLRAMFLRPKLAKDRVIEPHVIAKSESGYERLIKAYADFQRSRRSQPKQGGDSTAGG